MCVDIVTEICTCHLIQSSHAVVFPLPESLFKLLSLDVIYSVIFPWWRLKADENIVNNIMFPAWLILVFSMGIYSSVQSKPWISYYNIRNWDQPRLCRLLQTLFYIYYYQAESCCKQKKTKNLTIIFSIVKNYITLTIFGLW